MNIFETMKLEISDMLRNDPEWSEPKKYLEIQIAKNDLKYADPDFVNFLLTLTTEQDLAGHFVFSVMKNNAKDSDMVTLKFINDVPVEVLKINSVMSYVFNAVLEETDEEKSMLSQYIEEVDEERKEIYSLCLHLIDFNGYEKYSTNDTSYFTSNAMEYLPESLRINKDFLSEAMCIDPKFFFAPNARYKKVFAEKLVKEVCDDRKYISRNLIASNSGGNYGEGAAYILMKTSPKIIEENDLLMALKDCAYDVFDNDEIIEKFKGNHKIVSEMLKVSEADLAHRPFYNEFNKVKGKEDWNKLCEMYK